ncbi:tRNA lysidine(34) synthetase TilS [Microvirga rosea]|uniref:tRNA lysidine(34) synthetase TilS n=1 Tax=Microvirga rosea TaxID=2715425 RepID=UPI001D0A4428|nr:tRNA lysidine(34) synthetase TilS [Microvirga rosea]MCB8822335.1 tRNA lysidine(34) synthetase TilS [Microvirga rosea]
MNSLFSSLYSAKAILAAVSGGPDSMALMHLLAHWSQETPRPPIAVATVDHRLRPEAAQEADFVAREAAALGLSHHTLVWSGPKPTTGLQEAARDARYDLLIAWAHDLGATHLVTAHTLDDQAETVLIRLSRGSGLAGLGGMRPERDRDGLRHVRPLLACPKQLLLDLCSREEWPFVQDPSNADERFARVRWRRLMPALAAEGLTAERLAGLARRARQVEEALGRKAEEALGRAGCEIGEGALRLHAAPLAEEPFEIALRVLLGALQSAGIRLEASRLVRLEACTERLRGALGRGEGLRMTVAGALLQLDRHGRLTIAPEPPRKRGR